jgi:Ca2+-binding RTX toxin-like protein
VARAEAVRAELGEFYLYDEYDPRRAILLQRRRDEVELPAFSNSGHTCTTSAAGSDDAQFFLNVDADDATAGRLGCGGVREQRHVHPADVPQENDGNDVMFGDLGNDWLFGGTGQDDMYGGWGNDILNADDDLYDERRRLNDTTDTHAIYEDRVYGGAGIDI